MKFRLTFAALSIAINLFAQDHFGIGAILTNTSFSKEDIRSLDISSVKCTGATLGFSKMNDLGFEYTIEFDTNSNVKYELLKYEDVESIETFYFNDHNVANERTVYCLIDEFGKSIPYYHSNRTLFKQDSIVKRKQFYNKVEMLNEVTLLDSTACYKSTLFTYSRESGRIDSAFVTYCKECISLEYDFILSQSVAQAVLRLFEDENKYFAKILEVKKEGEDKILVLLHNDSNIELFKYKYNKAGDIIHFSSRFREVKYEYGLNFLLMTSFNNSFFLQFYPNTKLPFRALSNFNNQIIFYTFEYMRSVR